MRRATRAPRSEWIRGTDDCRDRPAGPGLGAEVEVPALARPLIAAHQRAWAVFMQVVKCTWRDGFAHAGNLAYLSLLTLFPFFIVVAAVAGALGRTDDGMRAVAVFMRTVPPEVAQLLAKPIAEVTTTASGRLLTLGIVVTLWTVSGMIETIREIIRRAYQSEAHLPVWRYRLGAVALIFAAVLTMMTTFALQVVLTGARSFVYAVVPFASEAIRVLDIGALAVPGGLFVSLYVIFKVLTPHRFRVGGYPVWPGALFTTVVWVASTRLLPAVLGLFGGYSLTYGSLAGVIVTLTFFYLIGIGLVVGAQINAALALVPSNRPKRGLRTARAAA